MDSEDEFEDESDQEFEPKITSPDPVERKLARQLRIQRRIEAIKKQHEQSGLEVLSVTEKSLFDKQTELSAEVLEQILLEGEEVITNVSVGNDTREVNRRAKEAAKRAEILAKLENESKDAEEVYEIITKKWEIISKYKDPLDISDSIALQKDLCVGLINQKDEIIAMLREQIDLAELKYVVDQETQKDDISTLVNRIDNQVDLMRKAYKHELELITGTVATERQILIDSNNKKWETLSKQRNIEEESNMQKKIDMADEFLQIFYDTRVQHEEKFRETKIALETEIEVLQKELEQLKASCLLNGEKLDYNYNILKKREDENLIIRSQQKRMMNKLQDAINKVKRNMKEYKDKSEETINRLMHDINKTRNSIFQIEDKADHICAVNDKKFQEVWDLNESRARQLLDKIKTTDKIIHEQLLGSEWKPPVKNFIKKTNLPSYKEAMEELSVAKQNTVLADQKVKVPILKLENGTEIPHSLLQSILEKIAFRSGFLLEKTIHTILPGLSMNNKQLIRADNVFNAIGITKPEHLKILTDLFLPYARCPVCEHDRGIPPAQDETVLQPVASATGQKFTGKRTSSEPSETNLVKALPESTTMLAEIVASELDYLDTDVKSLDESTSSSTVSADSIASSELEQKSVTSAKPQLFQCKNSHPIYIENASVFKILKLFVKIGHENDEVTLTLQKRINSKRNSLSRLLSQDDVKLFWNQFDSMFTKYHEDLWNGLLYGLRRYHSILEDRHKIYQDVLTLRKENFELRHMLKYCTFEKKKTTPRKKNKKIYSASTPNI